jgi:hypothetical protein
MSMRKIRLDVENLMVESFSTDGGEEKKVGTVHGHAFTEWEGCVVSGMSDCATCDGGCPRDTMTCFASCRMTNGYQACIDPYC